MKNQTIQFTGLSATGKTTLATELKNDLFNNDISPIVLLDGDVYRSKYKDELGFLKKDRLTNINSIAILAQTLNENNINVCVSVISPYIDMRKHCRELIEYNNIFLQVKCNCDFNTRIYRDINRNKKIVSIENDIYEILNDSDIEIDTGLHSINTSLTNIKLKMIDKKILKFSDL